MDNISNNSAATTPPESSQQIDSLVEKTKPKTISYSQYKIWSQCPQQWKLSYIDKLAPYSENINTAFGTAIHVPLQKMITLLYTEGALVSDSYDYYSLFLETLNRGVEKIVPPVDPAILEEFKNDGKLILQHMLEPSVRARQFPSKLYELVGIELPLVVNLFGGSVVYKAFLDVVLKDKITKRIKILDFKTSTSGWNKYQKADSTKLDQLLLYKRFYSKVFDIPMNMIDVEFIILKRKLLEGYGIPQRIQRFSPPDRRANIERVEENFHSFVTSCFLRTGEKNSVGIYPKHTGKNKKNCRYCPFKDMVDANGKRVCDGKDEEKTTEASE